MHQYIRAFTESEGSFDDKVKTASQMVWEDSSLWRSPIEQMLGVSLFAVGWLHNITLIQPSFCEPEDFKAAYKRVADGLPFKKFNLIMTQQPIGPYKADFMVSAKIDRNIKVVAVEADGHDFHEKTKKQAAHDKKRDRYFASRGITTLRFTGSEIHNGNHFKCAQEVYEIMGY